MKIYITAGEASGDVLGALLMKALKSSGRNIQFHGIGGPLMQREGLRTLFPLQHLSIMGLAEVLPKLKFILNKIQETIDNIKKLNPDILITIDSPDFSFRVAKGLRRNTKTLPLMFHYVAPTVWAWRSSRATKVAALYDGILCLYPFEPPYFQKHGMTVAYTGHPVMEQGYVGADGKGIRTELGIPADAPILGLLFGSRRSEVDRLGALLKAAAGNLQKANPGLHFLVPTLPHIESQVRRHTEGLSNVHIFCDPDRKPQIFAAMNAAIAVSGTVGLELAVANVPHVIAYKMQPLTWEIARRLLRVRFAHLANILLNSASVPEFIQDNCDPDKIAEEVARLLKDGHDVDEQCAAFATVRKLLNGKAKEPPSMQAAHFILDLYDKRNVAFVPYTKAG